MSRMAEASEEGLANGEHGGPSAVFLRSPAEADRMLATLEHEDLFASSCMKDQQPGDRAVIYETGREGAGLVAWVDIVSPAAPSEQFGFVAQCSIHRAEPSVPRSALMADPDLAPIFRSIIGRRWLPPQARAAIVRLSPPPAFRWVAMDEDWDIAAGWTPADPGNPWGLESSMQAAIARDPAARAALGLGDDPVPEVRSGDRRDRYDLLSDGVVAELKIAADQGVMEQLDRYLATLQRERPRDGGWVGRIVFCRFATRCLVSLVEQRGDVELWRCVREGESPTLERVA